VSGGDYDSTIVPAGEVIFAYLAATGTWEDSVHNLSNRAVLGNRSYDVRNATSTRWNVIVQNRINFTTDFQTIDYFVNGNYTESTEPVVNEINISLWSLYNNSAPAGSKFIPYVSNFTYNNNTPVTYGDVIWAYYNASFIDTVPVNWDLMR